MRFLIVLALASIGFAAEAPNPTPATAEELAALNAAEVKKLNLEISFQQSQIQLLQQQLGTMDAVYKAQAEVDKKLKQIRESHKASEACSPVEGGSWVCQTEKKQGGK